MKRRVSTMPLPINIDIRLLHLVKQNPILYDTTHPKYVDNSLRELAWSMISEELEMPEKACKSRWVNMRDHLRRKMRDRLTNPSNKHNKYKYEEEMAFIIPFFQKIDIEATLPDDQDDTTSSNGPAEKNNSGTAVKFDKDDDLKLIALVEKHLYDPSHPKTTDGAKELAWEKIADKMGRPVKVCKSRWVNIRDALRRKFKCRQFMTDANKMSRFKYKYENELAFLVPFFNTPEDISDYPNEGVYLEVQDDAEQTIDYDSDEQKDVKFEFRNMELEQIPDDLQLMPRKKRRKLDEGYDDVDTFLMSIGSTLRKLKPFYKNQVKSKIFEVVQQFELKQIVDTETEGQSSDQYL